MPGILSHMYFIIPQSILASGAEQWAEQLQEGKLTPAREKPVGLGLGLVLVRRALGAQTPAQEARLGEGARRMHAAAHCRHWTIGEEGVPRADH